jgi:hypothetical protein
VNRYLHSRPEDGSDTVMGRTYPSNRDRTLRPCWCALDSQGIEWRSALFRRTGSRGKAHIAGADDGGVFPQPFRKVSD